MECGTEMGYDCRLRHVRATLALLFVVPLVILPRAMRMHLVDWLKGLLSKSNKALFLYKRGMAKATNGEHQSAILDYTAAVEIHGVQPKVKAMAYYNRALAHLANKNDAGAVSDLMQVLDMQDQLPHIKTMARQKLLRIDRRA
jgi:hypothetical protein